MTRSKRFKVMQERRLTQGDVWGDAVRHRVEKLLPQLKDADYAGIVANVAARKETEGVKHSSVAEVKLPKPRRGEI